MGRLDISFAIYLGLKGEKCAKNVVLIESKQLKGEMQMSLIGFTPYANNFARHLNHRH